MILSNDFRWYLLMLLQLVTIETRGNEKQSNLIQLACRPMRETRWYEAQKIIQLACRPVRESKMMWSAISSDSRAGLCVKTRWYEAQFYLTHVPACAWLTCACAWKQDKVKAQKFSQKVVVLFLSLHPNSELFSFECNQNMKLKLSCLWLGCACFSEKRQQIR